MLKTTKHALLALIAAFGFMTATVHNAEAYRGRGVGLGIAAGIIGLGVGAAIANAHPRYYSRYSGGDACYYGARECHWTGRRCFENRWGDEVCRGGRYVCERPLVCE